MLGAIRLCVLDYCENVCGVTDVRCGTCRRSNRHQHLHTNKWKVFYQEELMDAMAGWRRVADVRSQDKTLRDHTDPTRVQTRADTSLNSQTKHGCVIRAITQQSSWGTLSVCVLRGEGITWSSDQTQMKLSGHHVITSLDQKLDGEMPYNVIYCYLF